MQQEKEKLTKGEKIAIIGLALSIILFMAFYIMIIVIYGQKPTEEMPQWIKILLGLKN